MEQYGGAKVFSTPDMNLGLYKISLDPRLAKLVLEHFHKSISEILIGLTGTVCMIDDVLVLGKNQEEHNKTPRSGF